MDPRAGAEPLKITGPGGASGGGNDLNPELGKSRGRARADPAGGAGNDNRTVIWRQAMFFQGEHRKHGGEAGGANRHRLVRRHSPGQAHQPIALAPRLLAVSAEMGLTPTPARTDYPVAGRPLPKRPL